MADRSIDHATADALKSVDGAIDHALSHDLPSGRALIWVGIAIARALLCIAHAVIASSAKE